MNFDKAHKKVDEIYNAESYDPAILIHEFRDYMHMILEALEGEKELSEVEYLKMRYKIKAEYEERIKAEKDGDDIKWNPPTWNFKFERNVPYFMHNLQRYHEETQELEDARERIKKLEEKIKFWSCRCGGLSSYIKKLESAEVGYE